MLVVTEGWSRELPERTALSNERARCAARRGGSGDACDKTKRKRGAELPFTSRTQPETLRDSYPVRARALGLSGCDALSQDVCPPLSLFSLSISFFPKLQRKPTQYPLYSFFFSFSFSKPSRMNKVPGKSSTSLLSGTTFRLVTFLSSC